MSASLTVVVCLAAITFVWKGAGSLLHRVPEGVATRLGGLAPALLAGLVLTQVVDRQGVPHADARAAGVVVAVGLAAARAPLAVTVIGGAAVTAGLRLLGAS